MFKQLHVVLLLCAVQTLWSGQGSNSLVRRQSLIDMSSAERDYVRRVIDKLQADNKIAQFEYLAITQKLASKGILFPKDRQSLCAWLKEELKKTSQEAFNELSCKIQEIDHIHTLIEREGGEFRLWDLDVKELKEITAKHHIAIEGDGVSFYVNVKKFLLSEHC